MNIIVKILSAVSGAGKSTYIATHFPSAKVCSADHFFMEDGVYKFDPSKLPLAHGACLRKFIALLEDAVELSDEDVTIIVDNTNTTVAEIAPYVAVGQAFGADVEIIHIAVDPAVAAARNTHGVSPEIVNKMHVRIQEESARLPPWWKRVTVTPYAE